MRNFLIDKEQNKKSKIRTKGFKYLKTKQKKNITAYEAKKIL